MTGIFYLPNKTLSMRQDLLTGPGQADAHVPWGAGCEIMNDVSGGNEIRPGAVNLNPAMSDFAVASDLRKRKARLDASEAPDKAEHRNSHGNTD